jgi:hypothetical protein
LNDKAETTSMPQEDFHPLPIGQTVYIFGLNASGCPFCEGQASISAIDSQPHYYRVRFRGDRVMRIRFVHPDFQGDPTRSLTLLTEFWRANTSPSFDDFFAPGPI